MRRSRRVLAAVALLALLPLGAAAALEPRALVLLRVEDEGARAVRWGWGRYIARAAGDVAPPDATYVSVLEGLGTADERSSGFALDLGWPVRRTLLSFDPTTTVGFVAFHPARGLAEEVLEPSGDPGAWSLRTVTLRLPAPAVPGLVTIDVHEPAPLRSGEEPVDPEGDIDFWGGYELCAPRTGIEFAWLSTFGDRRPTVALPPGSYVLGVDARWLLICGNSPPAPHVYVDAVEPFEVRAGEPSTVAHTFERGGRLALSATVAGFEGFAAENAPRLTRCFDSSAPDRAFGSEAAWRAAREEDLDTDVRVDPLLHVTAKLTPSAGGRASFPRFDSDAQMTCGARRRAVLGSRAVTLEQLPPGEYELSLSGPRVAPWTTTVTLTREACTEVEVTLELRGPRPRVVAR